jgi:predicted nucleic acid-binding protein
LSIFVDTAGIYAVLDSTDVHHSAAYDQWTSLLASSESLVTSNYVVVESSALVQRRLGMLALKALVDEALPTFDIEWVSKMDHQAAVEEVLAADRRGLSLVDCTSFQIMRRLGLEQVFTFDRHFSEQGFHVLPQALSG